MVVLPRPDLAENAGPPSTVPSASYLISPNENVPKPAQMAIRPTIMPKSPTRLTMNALLAAFAGALAFVPEADQEIGANADQLPAHEDHRHVAGHTRPNMLKQNSERHWKKRW